MNTRTTTIAIAALAVAATCGLTAAAVATDLPAPTPSPLQAGDTMTIAPGPGAELPHGLRNLPSPRAGMAAMPADCIVPGVHVGNAGELRWAATRGPQLLAGDPFGTLSGGVQAVALQNTEWDGTASTTTLITVNGAGQMARTVVTQDATGSNIAATPLANVGKVRSVAVNGERIFVLTDAVTPRLMSYTLKGDTLSSPTSLGRGSWASLRTISTRSLVSIKSKGVQSVADQLRGLGSDGSVVQVLAPRSGGMGVTASRISGGGWGAYRTLTAGVCASRPTQLPMIAARADGSADLWLDVAATKPYAKWSKVGAFKKGTLPAGRWLG